MISWFKKYFIPHEHNDHKPHLLRQRPFLFILLLVFLIELLFVGEISLILPTTKYLASILPEVLVDLTNDTRTADNISPLHINQLLAKAAQAKAEDMARYGYFAHTSPDGLKPWYWFDKAGYNFSYAGENLAVNFPDSKDVMTAWLSSPPHRENILDNRFTETGIGVANGIYEGREAIFVVQLFGRPASTETAGLIPPTKAAVKTNEVVKNPPTRIAKTKLTHPAPPNPRSEEMFSEVKGASEQAPLKQESGSRSEYASLAQKIFAMPRQVTDSLYALFLIIIATTLALTVFIRIRIQHLPLILNGVVLLLVLSLFLSLNQHADFLNARIF